MMCHDICNLLADKKIYITCMERANTANHEQLLNLCGRMYFILMFGIIHSKKLGK